jgi:hypothetical protein
MVDSGQTKRIRRCPDKASGTKSGQDKQLESGVADEFHGDDDQCYVERLEREVQILASLID